MASDWRTIIPRDLHDAFIRKVEDDLSAEIMSYFESALDSGNQEIVESELEADLRKSIELRYIKLFSEGSWPPKASANIGVVVSDLKTSNTWICSKCKERNVNSFETCQKCSESRPETSKPASVQPMLYSNTNAVKPIPLAVNTPTKLNCKDCGQEYPYGHSECESCLEPLDANKRHTWPSPLEFPDPVTRRDLRMKLFMALRETLDNDDPFSSLEISHEEFFQTVTELKQRLVSEHVLASN